MNEVELTAKELIIIKNALLRHRSGDTEKIIRKIGILLKEPEDEGGYVGVGLK